MTIEAPVLTPEYVNERQIELNRFKKLLKQKQNISKNPESYADEWAVLAGQYALIGAKANTAYCMDRYHHFSGTKPEVVRAEVPPLAEDKPFVPEPELPDDIFDWQGRSDIGD